MRFFGQLCIPSITLCLALASVANASVNETEIAHTGTSILRATLGGKPLEIAFTAIQVKNSDPLFPLEPDYAKEVSVIQRMTITIGGQSLFVPRSVFANLFDARKASLAFEKDAFVLSIVGADGAELYLVRVYFDGTMIHRRMVYDAFDSKTAAEDTRYRKGEVLDK